jgi:hypothetical protein
MNILFFNEFQDLIAHKSTPAFATYHHGRTDAVLGRETAWMAAKDGGYGKFLKFLQSKNFEAGKWHGCRSAA